MCQATNLSQEGDMRTTYKLVWHKFVLCKNTSWVDEEDLMDLGG